MSDQPIVTPWITIPTLELQPYERYLPTAFDESLTLLQKVNKLLNYVNDIGGLLNGIGTQWNEIVDWVMNDGLTQAVNAQLTTWLNDGTLATILGDLLNQIKQDLPFINLKNYIESNSLSQTVGFQDCLDLAKTGGGVSIIIPPAYVVTTIAELVIYSNTKIEAYGATIQRNHTGYLLMNGVRGSLTATGYNGNGNIVIEGGTWNINGVNQPSTASGFAFAHGKNLVFRDLTMKDANSHSIEINSSMNVLIDNVKCLGLSAAAENPTAEAIQLDFAGADGFPAFGAYDKTTCKNITWRKCYFGASGSVGTTAVARGMGTHGAYIGAWHENIVIEDCVFDGLPDYGINSYNWRNVRILNNTFLDCSGGIILYVPYKTTDQFDVNGNAVSGFQDCDNYNIYGNRLKGIIDKNHIRIYGTSTAKIVNCKIHHNTIEDSAGNAACIFGEYFDNLDVSHNTIRHIQNTGISVDNGTGFKAIANRCKDLNGNGITVSTLVDGVTIAENSISEVDNNGILISNTITNFTLIGNRTRNVNRVNGAYDHIHIVTSCSRGSLTGNIAKDVTNIANYALYITSTCSDIVRTGNVWRGVGSLGRVFDTTVSVAGGDLT
jgi:hypothetical protein